MRWHGNAKFVRGCSEVDSWEKGEWQSQLREVDILITTPQLFLDALEEKLVNFSIFGIIVIFECQHCHGTHPFAKICSLYVKGNKCVRVLGLSTRLTKKKNMQSEAERMQAIARMERLMESKVCTQDLALTFRHFLPDVEMVEMRASLASLAGTADYPLATIDECAAEPAVVAK